MKAYRLDDFTSLEDMHLREEDDPRPQWGEVAVRVHTVSLNFRDIAILCDRYPLPHRKGLVPTTTGQVLQRHHCLDDHSSIRCSGHLARLDQCGVSDRRRQYPAMR